MFPVLNLAGGPIIVGPPILSGASRVRTDPNACLPNLALIPLVQCNLLSLPLRRLSSSVLNSACVFPGLAQLIIMNLRCRRYPSPT